MSDELLGRRIAILATDGFEEAELIEPIKALRKAGATVEIVSPKEGRIQGMHQDEKADRMAVDLTVEQARPEDYSAIVLPGGVANPDALRADPRVVAFVRQCFDRGKPIAAICHGLWTLIEAGIVRGRTLTSWPSLKTDLRNAGATWIDREVVVDDGLITSRQPADLPQFCAAIVEEFQRKAA